MSIDTAETSTEWAYSLTAPFTFERTEDAEPLTAGPGELLVRLSAGAVCGSDMPFARGAMVPPLGYATPGHPMHEVVGTVVHSEHADFSPGDRVVGWATDWCALREQFVTRGDQVSKVRMAAPDAHVTVAQSVACLLTVFERLGSLEGKSVAIIGMGPFGLMTSVMAKERGAVSIVGVDPVDRTEDIVGLPVDSLARTTSRVWAASLAEQDRPDVIFEMVGHQSATVADAMNAIANGGTVVAYGVPDDDWYALPLRAFFRNNGTLVTGVTRHHREMLELAQDYLIAHPDFAQHIVTDVFPVERVEDAFRAAAAPRPGQRKVILTAR
ncbi:alcohol dehydrogenase catalytic domain-containing protein [Demequina aurantiaca]|uniref:alcohol dehydrogenase catalytic domain-containing protein n=1 Tax=Demequina aurantiaca TaxID=676200 RepID=UPI003D35243C